MLIWGSTFILFGNCWWLSKLLTSDRIFCMLLGDFIRCMHWFIVFDAICLHSFSQTVDWVICSNFCSFISFSLFNTICFWLFIAWMMLWNSFSIRAWDRWTFSFNKLDECKQWFISDCIPFWCLVSLLINISFSWFNVACSVSSVVLFVDDLSNFGFRSFWEGGVTAERLRNNSFPPKFRGLYLELSRLWDNLLRNRSLSVSLTSNSLKNSLSYIFVGMYHHIWMLLPELIRIHLKEVLYCNSMRDKLVDQPW